MRVRVCVFVCVCVCVQPLMIPYSSLRIVDLAGAKAAGGGMFLYLRLIFLENLLSLSLLSYLFSMGSVDLFLFHRLALF